MQWKCAWCGDERGPVSGETTHGICVRCTAGQLGLEVDSLAQLPQDAVDRLPYGFIRLDASDRIIEYNAAEGELAGRSRAEVMGRDFFRDVAPCTNVRELAGWVAAAREAATPAQTRVRFVFEFASGRQLADISLSCDGPDAPAHLLVRAISTEDDANG